MLEPSSRRALPGERMRGSWVVLMAGVLVGQEPAPPGILRGELASLDGSKTTGNMDVKAPGGTVYRCGFDNRTYMERSGQRIAPASLKTGDPVEMIADREQGRCFARTVRVVDARMVANPGYRLFARSTQSSA